MRTLFIALIIFALAGVVTAQTKKEETGKQAGRGKGKQGETARVFVDKNGDGFNDNAPDDDGDGIPNCIDPDFKGNRMQKRKMGFTDTDGDGINDNAGAGKGKKLQKGLGASKGVPMMNGTGIKGKGKGKIK